MSPESIEHTLRHGPSALTRALHGIPHYARGGVITEDSAQDPAHDPLQDPADTWDETDHLRRNLATARDRIAHLERLNELDNTLLRASRHQVRRYEKQLARIREIAA